MKNFGKLALLGAALAVSATSAFATPPVVTGAVGISAPDTFTLTTITFTGAGIVTAVSPAGTTIADDVHVGNAATMGNLVGIAPGSLADSGVQLFLTPTGSSNDVIFTIGGIINTQCINTITLLAAGATCGGANTELSVSGLGSFSEVDGGVTLTPSAGTFDITTTSSGTTTVTLDSTTVSPEPSSLMLLGTGLLGGAGMLMRRRRLTA
jgi:hypothetical protein